MGFRTAKLAAAATLGAAAAGGWAAGAGRGVGREGERPAGWFPAGSRPQDYEMALDTAVRDAERPSARIRATAPDPAGFGTLMQVIAADAYRGRRVRLAGDLRVRDVGGRASLWMRVDGACGQVLAFDNAQDRAARGTAEWRPQAVVLDVPEGAQGIFFGTLLEGGGTAWVSDLRLEPVPASVPVTAPRTLASHARPCGPAAPVNLDFAEPLPGPPR